MLIYLVLDGLVFFFFKQKTAYEMRISDWSSDVCSSDLRLAAPGRGARPPGAAQRLPAPGHGAFPRRRRRDGPQAVLEPLRLSDTPGRRDGWSSKRKAGLAEAPPGIFLHGAALRRSEEHTSELQSLMRHSYAAFSLK